MEVDDVSDFAGDESDDDDISVKETRGNGGVMDDEGMTMRGMTMIEGKGAVWWCVFCVSQSGRWVWGRGKGASQSNSAKFNRAGGI